MGHSWVEIKSVHLFHWKTYKCINCDFEKDEKIGSSHIMYWRDNMKEIKLIACSEVLLESILK